MANWSQFFLGAPTRLEQVPRFNPEQISVLQQLLQMGMQGMQDPYAGFQPIAQQARSQFAQQTVPTIAERFTSMGSGQLSSPAFASQLGQAGAGLEENLAAMQAQYGLQNRSQLAQLLGMGLQPQQDYYPMQQEPGFLQQTLPTLGRIGAHTGGGLLSGGLRGATSALSSILGLI